MLHALKVWLRPKISTLLEDELYQAERELILQSERCHRIHEVAVQADALMNEKLQRAIKLRSAKIQSQSAPAASGTTEGV